MPYKYISTDDETIAMAVSAMRELASIKSAIATAKSNGNDDEQVAAFNLRAHINRLNYSARRLEEHASWADDKPTVPEQMKSIVELAGEAAHEVGYTYAVSDPARALRNYFEHIKANRERAFSVLAHFLDDQRIKIQSLEYIIQLAMMCPTHRQKDQRLQIALDAIKGICEGLSGANVDDVQRFEMTAFQESWDYRKLASELHHKNSLIADLQNQLEEKSNV